jgi:OHCU decarboxylase
MRPIEELNASREEQFAAAVRPLFESAPALTRAVIGLRPFASYAEVIDQAEATAASLPLQQQIEVLSAHPRIGARPAEVSALSYREQGYAAESEMNQAELANVYARLEALNTSYEDRFGFRFVVFVNSRSKAQIVEALEQRLANSREDELRTGLREMFLIARDRLSRLAGD